MYSKILKANPYHAKDGTFTSKDKASSGSGSAPSMPAPSKARGSFEVDMGVVKPKISASSVNVGGESAYQFANGKKPSGSGNWLFAPDKSIDWSKNPKAGEDYFQAPYGVTYGDAKRQAKVWAAGKGHRAINVMS